MTDLVAFTGDALARVTLWTHLAPDERKRRAIVACQYRDADVLIDLTEAHLELHGKKGSRVSQNTREAYRIAIRALLKSWHGVNLLHVSADEAALTVRGWESAGLSPSTITVRLAGARALYRALRWAGAVANDPLADVRTAPDPTPAHAKRQPYSEDELRRILIAATDPLDRVLVVLGAHGGLRVAEVLSLRWGDIDMDNYRITVRRGKGGKLRQVMMSITLREAVSILAGRRSDSDYVIPFRSDQQARNRIQSMCAASGVAYKGYHALRHSCGTRIYRETGKLEDAQHHLGHSSISTTSIYAKWSADALKGSVANW